MSGQTAAPQTGGGRFQRTSRVECSCIYRWRGRGPPLPSSFLLAKIKRGTRNMSQENKQKQAKSEIWKQKRANMRASVCPGWGCVRACRSAPVCACACVRARARARARARPNGRAARRAGGPPRMGANSAAMRAASPKSKPARGRVPGVGRIVVVTHTPRGTPATSRGEHRRARRCSPSGGGGWKCTRRGSRRVMR
jgi:hypothetical protein